MESVTCFDYITSLKIGPKWGVPVCVVALTYVMSSTAVFYRCLRLP